jgi:prefoldin subunit 5
MSAWHRSLVFAILGVLLFSGFSVAVGNDVTALPTSSPLWTASQPANWSPQAAITEDGRYVAYTNSDAATLSLYDVLGGSDPLWTRAYEGPSSTSPIPVAFSGDGKRVTVATRLNNVMTYSVPAGVLLWTTNLNSTINSLAVDFDGSDTYVGMPNMVDKLDQDGVFEQNFFRNLAGEAFVVDTNDDGSMVLAVCPSYVAVLDEALGVLHGEIAVGYTLHAGKVADGRMTAAWVQSDGILGSFSLYIGGDASYFTVTHRNLGVGTEGVGSLDMSDDASTAFGLVGDIIFMYDMSTATLLWKATSLASVLQNALLTSDGAVGMVGGLGLGATLFGRETSIPLIHLDIFDLLTHAISGNGATALTGNQTEINIYRGQLDVAAWAQEGAAYYGQEAVLTVKVEVDGQPALGAGITASFSAPGVTYAVTDLGQGFYQVALLKGDGPSPLTLRVDLTATLVGQQPGAGHAFIVLRQDPFAELADQIDASESNLSAQMGMMWAALATQVRLLESNLSAQMTALGSALTTQLTSLSNGMTGIQTSINGLSNSWAATDAKVTSIQGTLNTLNANVSDVRATVNNIQELVISINGKLSSLQITVNNINSICSSMQSSLALVAASVVELNAKMNGLSATMAGVVVQINAMYASINSTMASVATLQSSVDQTNAALVRVQADMGTDYQNLSSSMAGLNSAVGANFTLLRAEVAAVSAQVQVVNGNVTAVSTQLGSVSTAVGVIESTTNDLKGKSDNSFLFGVLGMIVTIIMGILIIFLLTRKKKDFS